jgi:hypothetical protein
VVPSIGSSAVPSVNSINIAGLKGFTRSGPLATIGVAVAALGMASAVALLLFLKRALTGFNINLLGEVKQTEAGDAEFSGGEAEKNNPHRETNSAAAAEFVFATETALSQGVLTAIPKSELAVGERWALMHEVVVTRLEADFGLKPGEFESLLSPLDSIRFAHLKAVPCSGKDKENLAQLMERARPILRHCTNLPWDRSSYANRSSLDTIEKAVKRDACSYANAPASELRSALIGSLTDFKLLWSSELNNRLQQLQDADDGFGVSRDAMPIAEPDPERPK